MRFVEGTLPAIIFRFGNSVKPAKAPNAFLSDIREVLGITRFQRDERFWTYVDLLSSASIKLIGNGVLETKLAVGSFYSACLALVNQDYRKLIKGDRKPHSSKF